MKRTLFLLTLCMAALCASASNKYIRPDGDDGNDGKSWEQAYATIKKGINNCPSGDTVFIAEGVYNENISVGNGVTLMGGYNAATGERDIEQYVSAIDGTDKGQWLIVKYDAPPTDLITIDGLTLQNADHSQYGGGALFFRGNMVIRNCHIVNCKGPTAGAIYIEQGNVETQALVQNCVIELCEAAGSSGAIYNNGGIIENCIIRGCKGQYGIIRNETANSIVRNCLLYNNTASISGWPDCGGVYNKGHMINCTVCNNYGAQYAGLYSESGSYLYNNVFWGNRAPDDFTDHVNYASSSSIRGNNVTDDGSSSKFTNVSLNRENNAADGPNFRNPTNFVGAPTSDGEIAAMRLADFSLTDASTALLNLGDATLAPAKDINGVDRPKGTGVDIGAYEYDPDATAVAVTGVHIDLDTIRVIQGKSGTLVAIIEPADANNKRVNWTIDNQAVATIHNGAVTGVAVGETVARVETQDGGFKDTAIVVILPIPPVKYPDEVYAADELYSAEDYTVPSFIPFLIAKEAARIDSLDPDNDLSVIPERLAALNAAIDQLVGKEEPYNMIANINGDPATRMAFCWFTNEGITNGSVQLLPMANATPSDFESNNGVITINATPTTTVPLNYAVSTSGIAKAAKIPANTKYTYVSHKALAENLTPGTTYSWRVGYEGHWSQIAQFITKAQNQGNFSFLYMSDSHIQDAEYVENAKWCATAAAQNEQNINFCLFPGDFVETGTQNNSEWEWERWFEESIKPVLMKMTVVPTDGNHDDSPNLNYDYHFNTPTDFAMSVPSSYRPQFHGITYSFVYGDVLFLVYSLQDWWRSSSGETSMASTYLSTDVTNWFKEQIALHPNTKYRVTLAHKNIFSGSGHSIDDELPLIRKFMLPIFKECEIDLAIQGHDHCYEVIGPVNPDTRSLVEGAVSDVQTVSVDANKNATGKSGGTFVTDEGTMYFIGATCGRKRYYPHSEQKMIDSYTTDPALLFDGNHHDVENYFSLFTSMFGQPGAPSYSRFNVSNSGIEVKSYTADKNGNSTLYNTIHIVRNAPHSVPTGWENMEEKTILDGEKFIRDGQVLIRMNGETYNVLGEKVE